MKPSSPGRLVAKMKRFFSALTAVSLLLILAGIELLGTGEDKSVSVGNSDVSGYHIAAVHPSNEITTGERHRNTTTGDGKPDQIIMPKVEAVSGAITAPRSPLEYEFVVSHYNEDLGWLKKFANHAHVYHKGTQTSPPFQMYAWERLPNVGRESHTYLHHIIANYDRLSNVTIFLQGEIANHGACKPDNPMWFYHKAKAGIPCLYAGYNYKYMKGIPFKGNFRKDPKYKDLLLSNVTYAHFYEDLMGSKPPRGGVPFCHCGCFAATKRMILQHPLSFYEKAISYVNYHSNSETGHFFERTWMAIFKMR